MSVPEKEQPVEWQESHGSKLMRKSREAPFVPIGLAGFVGAVAYGVYAYKKKGSMSTSVYIMRFRVISQAMVVGAITVGVGMTVIPELWRRSLGKDDGPSSK